MSRPMHRARRRLWRIPVIVWLAFAVFLAGGSAAYAYFKTTGSGSGNATVSPPVTVTVTASSSPTSGLYPGGSGAVYFTLENTNNRPITFTEVSTASVLSNSTPSCEATTFVTIAKSLAYMLPGGTSITVGANATSATEHIATFVKLSATAPTACQGKKFTISLTLMGKTT